MYVCTCVLIWTNECRGGFLKYIKGEGPLTLLERGGGGQICPLSEYRAVDRLMVNIEH